MRTKVTLVLIFLNVALFYFIFFVGDGVDPVVDNTSILGPEVSNIQSLTISNIEGKTLTHLERRGEKWLLTEPLAWPANEFAVRSIVNELQFLRPVSAFPVDELGNSGRTLADYGLEKPPFTLSFTPAPVPGAPEPSPVLVRIGNATDVGNRLYILSPDGTRINVVPRSLAENLARTLQSLRSNELFTIQVFEVRSFNLEPAGGSRIRFRRENDRWLIEGLSVTQTRASKVNTELALSGLRELRVHNFIPAGEGEAARAALATPALRITVDGNNRRETLLLGPVVPAPATPAPETPESTDESAGPVTPEEKATLYYAIMEGDETGGTSPANATLFTVSVKDKFFQGTLLNAQRELREKQILDLDPATLSAITLSSPQSSEEIVLQRLEASAKDWQIVRRIPGRDVQTHPADASIVERLIASLLRLSAEATETIPAFIDVPSEAQKEALGFSRPARSISLTTTGASSSATIRLFIGSGQDRQTYARLGSQETIFHVSDEILNETPVDPLHYRQRLLRELPASTTITALKLSELVSGAVLLDTALPLPADSTLDRAVIDSLVSQLRVLRAKNFIASEFTNTVFTAGEERGWKYRLDATLMPGGSGATPITSTLFLADRAGGGVQLAGASDPGLNVVFEVEQPLLDALFTLTYGSRDPGPEAPNGAP